MSDDSRNYKIEKRTIIKKRRYRTQENTNDKCYKMCLVNLFWCSWWFMPDFVWEYSWRWLKESRKRVKENYSVTIISFDIEEDLLTYLSPNWIHIRWWLSFNRSYHACIYDGNKLVYDPSNEWWLIDWTVYLSLFFKWLDVLYEK